MLPYVVDCVGLTEDDLGYPAFPQALQERREWCRESCRHGYEIEPIRDEQMRLIGRRFYFADQGEATLFKVLFP
jgi:hypothetical protein